MIKRWILYLAALLGCMVFWSAYQGWLAWWLLNVLLWLPWVSLALCLVPILTLRSRFACPTEVRLGADAQAELTVHSKFFLPPYLCRLQVTHSLTGECWIMSPGQSLPTAHCGELAVTCQEFYVCDLLGLFRLPMRKPQPKSILIRPAAIPMEATQTLEKFRAHSWTPKPGGYAENHELRLYRPGDNLNQIHWKLTAKTGNLMIREPMVPLCGSILLTVDICGTADELDRKLGRILWLGQHLLELELPFEIRAFHKGGLLALPISGQQGFEKAMEQLLGCSPLENDSIQDADLAASWHFHIGGEQDEA